MSLDKEYLQAAVDQKRELSSHGVSPADFFSIITYDNTRLIIAKNEELEKKIRDLENDVANLQNMVNLLINKKEE